MLTGICVCIGSETRNSSTTKTQSRVQFSKDQQIHVLRETVTFTRGRFIAEFDYVDFHYIDRMTLVDFLEHIERERLTHMPHRGSRWDKVLKWAEFFAIQMSGYEDAVRSFVPDSIEAAKLIWVACRVLLDVSIFLNTEGVMLIRQIAWSWQCFSPRNNLWPLLQTWTLPVVIPSPWRSPSC